MYSSKFRVHIYGYIFSSIFDCAWLKVLILIYRIHYTPLIITTSTIKDVGKLKKILMTLGGHMVPEWNSKCDLVVMDSLTLTVKVVCALLSGKHIVHPSYFDDLYESVLTGKRRPDPKKFLPPLGERSLEAAGLSFDPNPARKKLFEGKTFLFASHKQLNKLKDPIKCGGNFILNVNGDL